MGKMCCPNKINCQFIKTGQQVGRWCRQFENGWASTMKSTLIDPAHHAQI
jgi:hypothetical protein